MQRVIDSGLSSGEDSDEDETAPEVFEEEVKEQNGWVNLEQATTFPPISLIKCTLLLCTKEDKKRANNNNKTI